MGDLRINLEAFSLDDLERVFKTPMPREWFRRSQAERAVIKEGDKSIMNVVTSLLAI